MNITSAKYLQDVEKGMEKYVIKLYVWIYK